MDLRTFTAGMIAANMVAIHTLYQTTYTTPSTLSITAMSVFVSAVVMLVYDWLYLFKTENSKTISVKSLRPFTNFAWFVTGVGFALYFWNYSWISGVVFIACSYAVVVPFNLLCELSKKVDNV